MHLFRAADGFALGLPATAARKHSKLLDDELSELELLFLLSLELELDFLASLISRLYLGLPSATVRGHRAKIFGAFIEFATPAQDPSRIA